MSATDNFAGFERAFMRTGGSLFEKEDVVDEVMVGFYEPEGGTAGEFAVRWRSIGLPEPTPSLEVFDDAWAALARMPELVHALAQYDGQNITPEALCRLLLELGFKDFTTTRGAT